VGLARVAEELFQPLDEERDEVQDEDLVAVDIGGKKEVEGGIWCKQSCFPATRRNGSEWLRARGLSASPGKKSSVFPSVESGSAIW
jgi:hypothetical protein